MPAPFYFTACCDCPRISLCLVGRLFVSLLSSPTRVDRSWTLLSLRCSPHVALWLCVRCIPSPERLCACSAHAARTSRGGFCKKTEPAAGSAAFSLETPGTMLPRVPVPIRSNSIYLAHRILVSSTRVPTVPGIQKPELTPRRRSCSNQVPAPELCFLGGTT